MFYSQRKQERVVATIGYPGHGKSIFLASLFWDSFFALSRSFQDGWQPYAVRALNDVASNLFYGNAKMLHGLTLPPANPRTKPEPAILEFKGIPRANRQRRRSIRLVFYDVAGEVFNDDRVTREYAPYVTNAHDLIFLFDPTHPDFSALSAAELVDRVYCVAQGGRKKNIIIALTKMDELRYHDDWWAGMINKLWPDETPSHSELPRYFEQMKTLSTMLENWWKDPARKADNLVNSLVHNCPTTHFCALSSLGHQPIWDCPYCGTTNHEKVRGCRNCDAMRADLKGPKDKRFSECPRCGTTNSDAPQTCGQCHTVLAYVSVHLSKEPEPFRVRDPLFWIFRAAGMM